MHKPFYASGFLYHSPSQQILLQQLSDSDNTRLVLFRGKSRNGNDPQSVFQQCVEKALGVSIKASSIHPVYDYIHDILGEHFIFFIETTTISPNTYSSDNNAEWCLLSKLSKLKMSEQTRHDIVVGERVIRSLTEQARVPQNPNSN